MINIIDYVYSNGNNLFDLSDKKCWRSTYNIIKVSAVPVSDNISNEIITVAADKNNSLITLSVPIKSSKSLYIIDAANYLKTIPGFSIIQNGEVGINNDIVFRGVSGSRLRILTGSGEILGTCFSHMDPPISYIDPETFDILNIIKGPQTVLWGPVTSGGILQFQRYHHDFNTSKVKLNSNTTIASNYGISRSIDSLFNNKYSCIRLIGNCNNFGDYRDKYHNIIHSKWYKWNADAILLFNLKSNTYLEINLGQGNGKANYTTKHTDGLCFSRESYGLKIESSDINNFLNEIEFQAWHHYMYHLMVDNAPAIKKTSSFLKSCCSNNNVSDLHRNLWGSRGLIMHQWNNLRCYSGIDIQINHHNKNVKCNDNNQIETYSQDSGIFVEFIFEPLLNNKIIGGARVEHSIFYINDFYNCLHYKFNKIYPAGFLRYENNICSSSLSYYLGIGSCQRFPDYWELISTDKFNKNIKKTDLIFKLKPEKTTQIDIGAHFRKSKIDGWVSSYIGDVKDFIYYYYNNNLLKKNIINNISNIHARICGAELGLNYQFNNYWYGESSMSWAQGVNIDDKCLLSTIFPLEGKLSCQFKKRNYKIGASWRLVSSSNNMKKMSIFIYPNIDLSKTEINFLKIPGFGIFSIYMLSNISKNHSYSFGIDNVFNKHYREYSNVFNNSFNNSNGSVIPEPGRMWWFKSSVKF